MTKRELQKIKSTITKAIKLHLKRGGKLIFGDFYFDRTSCADQNAVDNCKCPVQVVTDSISIRGKEAKKKDRRPATSVEFSKAVGITFNRDMMWSIISGYDKIYNFTNELSITEETYGQLFNLGKEIRKEFKPLTKRQINKIMGFDYV